MKKAVNAKVVAKVVAAAKPTARKVSAVKKASKVKKTSQTKKCMKVSTSDRGKSATSKTVNHPAQNVICAYTEKAHGPGWDNQLVWFITCDDNGVLRQECLQPEQQSAEIAQLYNICHETNLALTAAVKKVLAAPKIKAKKHK